MIKKILFSAIVLVLVACDNSNRFTVSGTITGADNQMLFFEYSGLVRDSLIDSVRLNKKGNFKFEEKSPAYPDLYKLRLGNQRMILGVDSNENILIEGDVNSLIDSEISGSEVSVTIQQLRKSVQNLQNQAFFIGKESDKAKRQTMLDTFALNVSVHKQNAMQQILKNPSSIASYFALYQQVNELYIISPYDKKERAFFSAVATSFDTYMPRYERTKNLHDLVIDAIRQDKSITQQQLLETLKNKSGINFPDITLQDKNGKEQKLSALNGKTILLDFSAAEMENKIAYTFELRDIYNTYASKGLQIYQISLDRNRRLWEQTTDNFPWICVHDGSGSSTSLYNVQSIPTLFLIDKEGNIIGRYTDFESLKKDIGRVI